MNARDRRSDHDALRSVGSERSDVIDSKILRTMLKAVPTPWIESRGRLFPASALGAAASPQNLKFTPPRTRLPEFLNL